MIRQHEQVFIINPLPERFGTKSHIVYEIKQSNTTDESNIGFNSELINSIFHPNVKGLLKREKRRISATEKIPQVLHIETAIFVDKDLYKHMAINFANDTESQIIRFVLALVNGVRFLLNIIFMNRKLKLKCFLGSTSISSSIVGVSDKFCA